MSLDASFRAFGERPASLLVRVLVRLTIEPNDVTIFGITMMALASPYLMAGHFLMGGGMMLVGLACDWLDGALARRLNLVTKFGAFLDSVGDRLSDVAPLLGVMTYAVIEEKMLLAVFSSTAILMSVLTPYIRAKAESLGLSATNGWLPRAARAMLLLLGVFLAEPTHLKSLLLVTLLISILGGVTVVQRIRIVYEQLEARPPV